jgi:hypothetical protein
MSKYGMYVNFITHDGKREELAPCSRNDEHCGWM